MIKTLTLHALLVLGLILSGLSLAYAQPANKSEFRIGAAAVFRDRPYNSYDNETDVFPFIVYRGEGNFFINVNQLGYRLIAGRGHNIAIIGEFNGDAFDSGESTRFRLFRDRDPGFHGGLQLQMRFFKGMFTFKALHDVTDESDGAYLDVSYAYPWQVTQKLRLIPQVGFQVLTDDYADHYYGVSAFEASLVSGVSAYSVGESTRSRLSLIATYDVTPRWQVFGLIRTHFLDSDIEDSPLVGSDTDSVYSLAVNYKWK